MTNCGGPAERHYNPFSAVSLVEPGRHLFPVAIEPATTVSQTSHSRWSRSRACVPRRRARADMGCAMPPTSPYRAGSNDDRHRCRIVRVLNGTLRRAGRASATRASRDPAPITFLPHDIGDSAGTRSPMFRPCGRSAAAHARSPTSAMRCCATNCRCCSIASGKDGVPDRQR